MPKHVGAMLRVECMNYKITYLLVLRMSFDVMGCSWFLMALITVLLKSSQHWQLEYKHACP